MNGMDSLRHAIRTVPIPGAPPRLSHSGAAIGLALLDTSLRLNHVRRLTERLALVEHGTARRTTEVDISLKLLDDGQREASTNLRELMGKEHGERFSADAGGFRLWVPIARLPRNNVSAVDVYDGTGHKLPRLSQHEVSRLLASGFYLLLRGILSSDEHAHSPKKDLSRFLFSVHEPRWLVQHALITLLTERNPPDEPFTLPSAEGTVPGYGNQCRELALQIFDDYGHLLVEYQQLLDIAVRDYLLVVGLAETVEEHRVSYEAPLYVDGGVRDGPLAELWRRLRSSGSGYFASYQTTIPATLTSYHLVATTAPEADLTQMYLSTDADRRLAAGIVADLGAVADHRESIGPQPTGPRPGKVLELQAQSVLRTLADLLRRRKWEADCSGVKLPPDSLVACHKLAAAATTGDAVRTSNNELDNSILGHPDVVQDNLRAAAIELTDYQLADDLVLINNVTDNEAQAYWRRSGTAYVPGEQVRIRAGMVLRDSTESGPRNVTFYALAVALICYGLGCLLVGSLNPFFGSRATEALGNISDGQSVITMLLLVPGFLYTRLALPPRRTVAAYLRTLPRILGQVCVVSSAGLAAAVATSSGGQVVQVFLGLAVGVPMLAAIVLTGQRLWLASNLPLSRIGVPRWVDGSRAHRPPLVPNVGFGSAGAEDG
jgi:hypothetical protein